jgi:hypothetical protein
MTASLPLLLYTEKPRNPLAPSQEPGMVLKIIIISVLLLIVGSLFSALTFLYKDKGRGERTVRALSWRIGLSLGLFILLMAGYYLGIITPHGINK